MNLNRFVVLTSVLSAAVALAPRSAHAASPSFELPALQSSLVTGNDPSASDEAPRRWHLGFELGAGVNPWGGNDTIQAVGSLSAYFGWDVTEHFELEALASVMLSVETGGYGGGVRALYWFGDHVAVGATLGYAAVVYGGPHIELRAGPVYLAYEPIVISSSHALDYHDKSEATVIPLRALLGVQF